MTQSKRILALDVFRGMTIMFMIIVNTPGSWSYVYPPLRHAEWIGCTPTDLVFPFFVFIVGLSMALSLGKMNNPNKKELVLKTFKRAALIFLVGLFLNWFPFIYKSFDGSEVNYYFKSFSKLRIMGVLQKIAISYAFAATIIIYSKKKSLPIISAVILLFYWWMLWYFGGASPYSLEDNIVRYVDLDILGANHMYKGFGIPFDPEGILSSVPSIVTVLIGYSFGGWMLSTKNYRELVKKYTLYGVILIGIGYLWGLSFPIIKALWTSSYVLYTAGIALVFFSILIYLIDILKWTKWTYPFKVFGLNPLFSFALSGLILKVFLYVLNTKGTNPLHWTYTHVYQPVFGNYLGSFVYACVYMLIIWFFAWLLYRKHIVIKL